MSVRYILSDIEGTTTSITFVHDVLFPYSRQALPAFVRAQREQPEVREALALVRKTCQDEGVPLRDDDVEGAIAALLEWIAIDRKHPGLKRLQGLIWQDGYEKGDFTAHIYEDVVPRLRAWKQGGLGLGIYSSGSVLAQKLLFGHTSEGDLTPLFSHFFDTAVGPKKDVASYRAIQKELGIEASAILFLSDIEAELDAAKAAGMATTQLVRPGTLPSQRHPTASSFADIRLEREAKV